MLGTKLCETEQGYIVYAVLNKDVSSLRLAVDVYVVTPENEMSKILTFKRCDVLKKKKWTNIFLDMDGGFTKEDLEKLQTAMDSLLSENGQITLGQSCATVEEVHRAISKHIRENKEELSDNPFAECFVKDDIGYMATSQMEKFIKANSDLGYKRLEVLKHLKYLGVLQPADDRAYDTLISLNGKKLRYYKFQLAEKAVEKDVEVITA